VSPAPARDYGSNIVACPPKCLTYTDTSRPSYFQRYAPTGILEPGSDPEAGVFNGGEPASSHGGIGAGELPPTELQVRTMTDAHKTPEYLAFLEHANLRGFVRELMGWDSEVLLRRTMLRHNVPGGLSTAVHYDKLFLRGGEAYFLTAWVPIGAWPHRPCHPLNEAQDVCLSVRVTSADRGEGIKATSRRPAAASCTSPTRPRSGAPSKTTSHGAPRS